MVYFLYILRCSDNTYYTGYTTNLAKRLHSHNNLKTGAKYTRVRRPVQLLYSEAHATLSEVLQREVEIKKLTRTQKEQLWRKEHTI